MSCLKSLAGIAASCDTNLAGIKAIYLANFDDVTVTVDESGHTVSAITMADSAKFYAYHFAKQTGSLTSTITKDETNGTRYYTNVVALQFTKLEAAKHIEVEALASGQLIGIVEDNNSKKHLVGYDSYLSADEATAQTGQSFDDLNGYNLSMSAMSAYLPFFIEDSLWNTFKEANVVEPA